MCGSEQGHSPDPKSLAAFGPGDSCRDNVSAINLVLEDVSKVYD
jgi:hypothetical protein